MKYEGLERRPLMMGEKSDENSRALALNETVGENCFLARTTPRPVFVFVSAAGQYFSILTGPDQYDVFFRILSELVFCLRYTIKKTCRLTDLHVLSVI